MYLFCKRALRKQARLARLAPIESAADDIALSADGAAMGAGGRTVSERAYPSRRRRRSLILATGGALACVLGGGTFASRALAIYGPAASGLGAEIVSVDNASDEQANAATTDAAISGNGRYVVFQTRATNFFEDDGGVVGPHGVESDAEPAGTLRQGGIFRYDRDTGAIQLVADGTETYSEGPEKDKIVFRGAEGPSISADGRYVAFTTTQQLVPQDTNPNSDVYVRDMDVPLRPARKDSGAYMLVSARDGGEEPAQYASAGPPQQGGEPGSEAWPHTSISADGRYVVFRTPELVSDLPNQPTTETPPEQLFVRNIQAKTTTLITRKSGGGEPAGGALGPATISADGSTVSWVGAHAPAQTRFLPGEPESVAEPYYLWRRWQEPSAPIRRITGIGDPDDPNCLPGESITVSQTIEGPCYGPLSEPESGLASIALTAPGLSADGQTVAFLAGAALRPNITKSSGLDVFLTSMAPGESRKAGTRELTLGVQSGNIGSSPSIESLALSADGSTIAFTSLRTDFVLPEPILAGSFRPFPTVPSLYVIHVPQNTLERAVVNYEGTDPAGPVHVNPTLSSDGSALAFVSPSSDFIFGDANQLPDAFAATLQPPGGTAQPPPEVNTSGGGFSLTSAAAPELGLHVKRGKAGQLLVLVETPGAGTITCSAKGKLAVKARKHSKRRSVVLAKATAVARSEGTTTLLLRLVGKYTPDLKRLGRISVSIKVGFKPSSPGESLSAEAGSVFVSSSGKKAARH
jgi:Tol biopolymer transport system component